MMLTFDGETTLRFPIGSYWVFKDNRDFRSIWQIVPESEALILPKNDEPPLDFTVDVCLRAVWASPGSVDEDVVVDGVYPFHLAYMMSDSWWRIEEEDIPLFILGETT